MLFPGSGKTIFQIYLSFFFLAYLQLPVKPTTSFLPFLILLTLWLIISSLPSRLRNHPFPGKEFLGSGWQRTCLLSSCPAHPALPACSPTGSLPVGVRNSDSVCCTGERGEEGLSPRTVMLFFYNCPEKNFLPVSWEIADKGQFVCCYLCIPRPNQSPNPSLPSPLRSWHLENNNESQERAPQNLPFLLPPAAESSDSCSHQPGVGF